MSCQLLVGLQYCVGFAKKPAVDDGYLFIYLFANLQLYFLWTIKIRRSKLNIFCINRDYFFLKNSLILCGIFWAGCYSDFQVNEPHFYISRILYVRVACRRQTLRERREGAFAERPVGKEERNTDIGVWSKYLKTAVSRVFEEYYECLKVIIFSIKLLTTSYYWGLLSCNIVMM